MMIMVMMMVEEVEEKNEMVVKIKRDLEVK